MLLFPSFSGFRYYSVTSLQGCIKVCIPNQKVLINLPFTAFKIKETVVIYFLRTSRKYCMDKSL